MSDYIYQVKIMEDWDRGSNLKDELFFNDYDGVEKFLTKEGYELKRFINGGNKRWINFWEKDYGYQAKVYKRELISR